MKFQIIEKNLTFKKLYGLLVFVIIKNTTFEKNHFKKIKL